MLFSLPKFNCHLGISHLTVNFGQSNCSHWIQLLPQEMKGQIKCSAEDSNSEYSVMKDIFESISREAAHNAKPASQCQVEDADMQSIIMQGLSEVIYREAWKDAEEKLNYLNMKYIDENEIRVSCEKEVLLKEEKLKLEVKEKQRLRQQIFLLKRENEKRVSLEVMEKRRLRQEILFLTREKEKLAQDSATALEREMERLELAAKELENLRDQTYRQQTLISESSKELNVIKANLAGALEEIELYKMDIGTLNQKLEQAMNELREVDEERRTLFTALQEKQNVILLCEANESEVRKQVESVIVIVNGLLKAAADFECRVTENISKNCLRLKSLDSQSFLLIRKGNILRRTGLLYKQRLDRKCSDLQKAEAEVDILGGKVDTLSSLLEKIYIVLDHYSPILQHYPGIIEILKLVKRELSGESTRSV